MRFGVVSLLPGLLGRYADRREDLLRNGFLPLFSGCGRRCCPVVTVAPDRADDLFFGNDFENRLEVVGEPILGGNRSGTASGLVLVVVHDEQAVGVVGKELVVEVFIMRRNVDVETKMAGMKIGVELGD